MLLINNSGPIIAQICGDIKPFGDKNLDFLRCGYVMPGPGDSYLLGPILWGFIGAVAGFAAGLAVGLIKAACKKKNQRQVSKPQVVVLVRCPPEQIEKAASILWTNAAMGVKSLS